MFAKLVNDRRGSVAILFGLTAIVIFMAAGFAIDMVRAVQTKAKVQAAVDSAALSANYQASGKSDAEIIASTKKYLESVVDLPAGYDMTSNISLVDGKVIVHANVNMPTYFAKFANINHLDIGIESETVVGKTSFDVVMVLDNSGSMGGSKIRTLRSVAKDLSETLFSINEKSEKKDRVKIGIVPFTSFVNVGTQHENAAWMDREGRSPIHWTNFETRGDGTPDPEEFDSSALYNGRPSRFSLYKQLRYTDWMGCVEARPMPYDVTDDVPSKSNPATLFVPEFAPDEPDYTWSRRYGRSWDSYYNNWLNDDGGVCSEEADEAYRDAGMPLHEYAQKRLCKYREQKSISGWNSGPNYWCKTRPIVDLTNDKNMILAEIDDMEADGHTNIHQGVVWGWRVLSPQAPFTNGREMPAENSDEDLKRVLIVMTDGANTYQGQNSFNRTRINAYGYGAEERLGNNIDSSGEIQNKMDERTALACENAKRDGEIDIYTISFQIRDQATINMMRNCATRSSMAYKADSNSALLEAFERIAEEITKLRLNR